MGHATGQRAGRIGITLTAAVALTVMALGGLSTAGTGSAEPAAGRMGRAGSEITSLRSRHARTFVTERGTRVTRVYSGAVNYRAGDRWELIDNSLESTVKSGYALRNGANRYTLDLPRRLGDDPVEVATEGSRIAFSVAGASSSQGPTARGATGLYADAFRDADIAYTAQGDSVKEAVTMRSSDAPSSYRFPLTMSPGLEPRETPEGGIDFVNAEGDAQMSFAPPYMSDAAGVVSHRVSMQLVRRGGSYAVDLDANRDWLQASNRRYPVVIDPTTNINAGTDDCYLVGGSYASTHFCGYAFNWLDVGTDGGAKQRRTYLKFDLTAIPKDAEVIEGDVHIWKNDGSARIVQLYRLTRTSTSGRTWNTYDGSNPWTTPGGDIGSSADASTTTTVTSGWNHWYARKLVQAWVEGTVPNYGALLKDTNSSPLGDVIHFRSSEQSGTGPYLEVEWQHKLGVQDRYTMKSQRITSGLGLMTNVGNGNLVIQQADLQVPGQEDLNVDVTRYFNNLDVDGGGGDLGFGWNLGTGYDFWLNFEGGGSTVAVNGPSGYWAPFDKRADGSYEAPPGVAATLTKATDGTYKLVYDDSDDTAYNFSSTGFLTSVRDMGGMTISFAYGGPGGKLSQVSDTNNGITRFTYNAAGYVDTVTDPANKVWRYGYTGSLLTSVTRPDAKVTRFEWDSSYNPIKITDVDGKVWRLTYDSQYRVTSIKQVTDPVAGTGPTTTYSYGTPTAPCTAYPTAVGKTVETDPDGTVSTYCTDASTKVLNNPPDYQACLDDGGDPTECAAWWREEPPAVDPGLLDESDPVDDGIDDFGPCYAEEAAVDCDTSSDEAEPQLLVAAAAQDDLIYGIADDGEVNALTQGGYFAALKVRRIRRIIPYDIMKKDSNGNFEAAYNKFKAVWNESRAPTAQHPTTQNLDIMVTFRVSDHSHKAPTVSKYRKWTMAFKRRFGKRVSAMGAWNEPNRRGNGTGFKGAGPIRAAKFAWILRRDVCKPTNCTAVAGEFETQGQWTNYMSEYKDEVANHTITPSVWALHPYLDVHKQVDPPADLTFFLGHVPASASAVWLTEVGSHIDGRHESNTTEAAQRDRVQFLVNHEAHLAGPVPIRRLYYYAMWEQHMSGAATFDTGLLTPGTAGMPPTGENGGVPRLAYDKYKEHTLLHPRG